MSKRRRPVEAAPPPPAALPSKAPLGALIVGLLVLKAYVWTLAPGLAAGDSADLQTAAGSLGIAHPPGYPTYTMLGWLFSRLSPADPAWGVNLMTALFGALASAAAFLLAAELTGLLAAGAVAGLALGLTPLFWHHALAAEVFTMNAFFAALLLWLAVRVSARPTPRGWILGAGVFGLAMTHHHTTVLLLPSLAVLLWPARRVLDGRTIGLGAAALAAGLLPYLYPLIRAQANPGLNWDDPHTLGGLLHLVRRADYGTFSLLPGAARGLFQEASAWDQVPLYLGTMLGGPWVVVGLLALAGLVVLARRNARAAAALALFWLLAGPGFLMYARYPLDDPFWVGVVERFYLLPQVPLAVLAGCAMAALPAGVGYAVAVGVAALGLWHLPQVDRSRNTVAQDYVDNLLSGIPQGALVLTLGDAPGMLLEYAQLVQGKRPDLVCLDQDKLFYAWYVDSKRRRHPSVSFPWRKLGDGSLADLVAANYGTRPIVIWRMADRSLNGRFQLLPAGLAQRVAEPGEAPAPEALAAEVERLWKAYEKRSLARSYSPRSFDHLITSFYGFPAYSVGFEFEKSGQTSEALAWYRKATEAAPHYALPYRSLGLLEAAQGDRQSARTHLSKYLELEPNASDAEEVRHRRDSL